MATVLYEGGEWDDAADGLEREQARQVDMLMGKRLELDDEHRSQLRTLLTDLAGQLDRAGMLASSIRKLETDRFSRALDAICGELGVDADAEDRFEAAPELTGVWELLDELGDDDGSLSDQADLCRELAERLEER